MERLPRLPRICITATGTTPGELIECARRALAECPFVELRLDWVTRPAEAIVLIPRLREGARRRGTAAVLQATCRREANGGRFRGSVAQQMGLLRRAVEAGCGIVDLEIESAEAAGQQAVSALRQEARVILSFHDFRATPPLRPVVRRMTRFPADHYKVVPTARQQSDNCSVLDLLGAETSRTSGAGKWIAFAMGECGMPSRILALSRGSACIYAAPTGAAEATAAPGQIGYTTLQDRYRVERLNRRTAILGVLGNPVRQSIGVAVHNAAFRVRRLDAVYLPLLASDVRDFHAAAARYPLAGFSVTIPHKRAILRYVDRADRWVKLAGAANTVRIRRGRWEATNTDVAGIIVPLRKRYRLAGKDRLPGRFRAVIAGYGGAARAAAIAMRALGCRDVSVTGRDPAKLRRFAKELQCEPLPLDALRSEPFDLLIHATPVGMWPRGGDSLLRAEQLRAETIFDLIYNPPETRLLQFARARGCHVISGLEMYLAQAAAQFRFWTGREAPLRTMRQAALQQLSRM